MFVLIWMHFLWWSQIWSWNSKMVSFLNILWNFSAVVCTACRVESVNWCYTDLTSDITHLERSDLTKQHLPIGCSYQHLSLVEIGNTGSFQNSAIVHQNLSHFIAQIVVVDEMDPQNLQGLNIEISIHNVSWQTVTWETTIRKTNVGTNQCWLLVRCL